MLPLLTRSLLIMLLSVAIGGSGPPVVASERLAGQASPPPTGPSGAAPVTLTARLCLDPAIESSCLDRDRLLAQLWPQSPVGTQGARLPDGSLLELVALRGIRTDGDRQFALSIFERVRLEPQGRRPDCHACVPGMELIVWRERERRWSVLARSTELQGPGSWGELSVRDLRVEHLGGDRFLIGLGSGYTGQGVTETALSWYGNLAPSGAASPRVIDLGTISTGSHVCGTGHLQESREAQVVTLFQGAGLPAFLRIENSRFCRDDQPPVSRAPSVHPIDPVTMRIRVGP